MEYRSSSNKLSIGNILLVIIVSELVLLGSGRLLEIGFLTLRMILFIAALVYVGYAIFTSRIKPYAIHLVLFFFCSLLIATAIGSLNGAETNLIFEDFKPLSYFFMLIYFSVVIDEQRISLVSRTIKTCCLILVVLYLGILLAIQFNFTNYNTLYELLKDSSDFSVPEGRFIYKGLLYLGVGFVFFVVENSRISKWISALFVTAIVLILTRGLLLAIFLVYLAYLLFFSKINIKKIFFFVVLGIFIFLLAPWYLNKVGDRVIISNLPRIIAYEQVKESLTPSSLLFGHGFGIGVEERPIHMEITYLEILHKQGLIGLFFWGLLFVMIIKKYNEIKNKSNKGIALPYVLSTILVYLETATNPFLNNPIGMSIVLITLSVVDILRNGYQEIEPTVHSGEFVGKGVA